nr:uncharacterized protein LOC109183030 [Ipomoea batatas]
MRRDDLGKYLGSPTWVGRNKKAVFDYLCQRIRQRVNGWQKKLLSRAGKEVLLKSIAQALPTFTMSVFLIPKTMCEHLEREMNRFWWCGEPGNYVVSYVTGSQSGFGCFGTTKPAANHGPPAANEKDNNESSPKGVIEACMNNEENEPKSSESNGSQAVDMQKMNPNPRLSRRKCKSMREDVDMNLCPIKPSWKFFTLAELKTATAGGPWFADGFAVPKLCPKKSKLKAEDDNRLCRILVPPLAGYLCRLYLFVIKMKV